MITPELHLKPVALNGDQHRKLVLQWPLTDWSRVSGMNALFLSGAECVQAARDFPILFIQTGKGDKDQVEYAPIAVFGLSAGENLFVENKTWRGEYMPAVMSLYPMGVARVDAQRYAVCIDESYEGLKTEGPGERLFDDEGKPTEFMAGVQMDLERLEALVDQTRNICRRLAELGLFVPKRLDANLADGKKLSVDGFFTIDEEKVQKLPDETVLEFHRHGLFNMIHAHWLSMGNMKRLLKWRLERNKQAALA